MLALSCGNRPKRSDVLAVIELAPASRCLVARGRHAVYATQLPGAMAHKFTRDVTGYACSHVELVLDDLRASVR